MDEVYIDMFPHMMIMTKKYKQTPIKYIPYTYNHSTREAEASVSLRPTWSKKQDPEQPGQLHRKTSVSERKTEDCRGYGVSSQQWDPKTIS